MAPAGIYFGSRGLLQLPISDGGVPPASRNSKSRKFASYRSNGHLGGLITGQVAQPHRTLMLGEGTDLPAVGIRTDATFNLKSLPQQRLDDPISPLKRHQGGANYAFADGHVARLQPAQVAPGNVAGYRFTAR